MKTKDIHSYNRMSTEADSLRRSKRNKFHLDVATMHLAHPERRRTQQGRLTPSPDVPDRRTTSVSPARNASPVNLELSDEKSRRVRRTPARNASYVFEDSDDDDCRRGLEGTNMCVKCPARFETRPGLANHFKLHFGEKRKFACEICDFSATTMKSLRIHQKIHDRYGVGPAPLPDSQENQPYIEDLHCEMSTEPAFASNSSPPQLSPPIAYSTCPSRTQTELSYLASTDSPQSRRTALASPMTPPPNLVRANIIINSDDVANIVNSDQECQKELLKCMECPYIAKTTSRLKIHNIGHQKISGFQCPLCTFKSESTGFLKRHVEMHGCSSFTWPPNYVGVSTRMSCLGRNSTRSRSIVNLLFLRCASQHAPIGSPMRWPCPILGCNFSAAVVSQHVVHHVQSHVTENRRSLLRHICFKCGICMGTAGALQVHKIVRHTRRHHPRTLLYFIRERLGYRYVRNFVKPKIEIFDEVIPKAELYQYNQDEKFEMKSVKVEADDGIAANAISTYDGSLNHASKDNEFTCALCPYTTSTQMNLHRHVIRHQVKDSYRCAYCSFSGRSLEFIEKHSRVHQKPSAETSIASNTSSSQIQLPPVVLVPMSTVSSLIPLSNSAPVITVSLTTVPGEQITVPTNTPLPITFATILGSTIVPSSSVDSVNSCVQQQTKCPQPRRVATEPSLRFVGSDGVRRRRCLLCPYMSKFSCDMRSHMEMHALNARFKCSQCSYSTKRAVSLRSHIALHTEDNAIRAKNSKALNIVVQKVLIGVKRGQGFSGFYTCAHCPFVTCICAELWRHARRHMGASKRFNCSLCSFSSISLDVMEQHQLLHPEGLAFIRQNPADDEDSLLAPLTQSSVELKCDICPFKTTIYQRMWNHKQKHKKASKFVCNRCSFSTGSELCLEDHMVVHSEHSSVVNTGAAPSPSASTDLMQKSSSEKSISPDSQKVSVLQDSGRNSPMEVSETKGDGKNPLMVKVEYERALRPTKEVLPILKSDRKNQVRYQCPDCPFMESDEMIFDLHREMHGGRTRAFACNICNYSCFAPETLHWHLSLHLPSLTSGGAASQKKRGLGRRGFQPSDPIPLGAKHFACTQCSFRTVNDATFLQHRQQHAQHIQQRLVTQMKRAASQQEEDSKRCSKAKRTAKKSDKHHACLQCTFRCDTSVAFSRHLEMHKQNAIFKCRICDYSANTKKIVDFHEQNHHLGQSLTELRKSAILAPEVVRLNVTASSDERARLGGQDLRCRRCHYSTLDLSAYTKHWEQNHGETPEGREVVEELRMKLVPPSSILTTA